MAQSEKRDLPAANDPVPDNVEWRDVSEELRVKSEDLREYSQAINRESARPLSRVTHAQTREFIPCRH
jgi:hypothetical protein